MENVVIYGNHGIEQTAKGAGFPKKSTTKPPGLHPGWQGFESLSAQLLTSRRLVKKRSGTRAKPTLKTADRWAGERLALCKAHLHTKRSSREWMTRQRIWNRLKEKSSFGRP